MEQLLAPAALEAVGGIITLMPFEPELRLYPQQCRLPADACAHALDAVTGEVCGGAMWRAVDPALHELHRAFRDTEGYVRQCLDLRGGGNGGWWERAAAPAHDTECVEQHLHGIIWYFAAAAAAEIAGDVADEISRRRVVLANKYDGRCMLDEELVARIDTVWKQELDELDEMKSRRRRRTARRRPGRRLS